MKTNLIRLTAECIKKDQKYVGENRGFTTTTELLEWYAERTEKEIKGIHREMFGANLVNTTTEDKNSNFIGYEGVLFSHYDSDDFGAWAYVCEECLKEHGKLAKHVGEENGFVCSVAGCFNTEKKGHTIRVVDIDLGMAREQRVEREKAQSLVSQWNFKEDDAKDIVKLIIRQEGLIGRQIETYDFVQAYEDYGIRWDDAHELLKYVNEGDKDSGFGIVELWESDYHFPLRSGMWITWRW